MPHDNDVDSNDVDDSIEICVTEEDVKTFKRLDVFLAHKIPQLSRTFIKKLHSNNLISNQSDPDKKLELKKIPKQGTVVEVVVPPPIDTNLKAQNIPLEIVFEDEDIIIVNKAAGMVTHPAPGNYDGTLVNAVLYHCPDIEGVGGVKRPGIVHRLDKGTSGILVIAKNQKAHEHLVIQFSTHSITRLYEAIVLGRPPQKSGRLESIIGRHPNNRLKMSIKPRQGKNAITHYKLLSQFTKTAHVELKLETGRTHQIRVHLSSILNCPILCDPVYGNPKNHLQHLSANTKELLRDYPYQLLHAKKLGLIHPRSGQYIEFDAPPPNIFQECLKREEETCEG